MPAVTQHPTPASPDSDPHHVLHQVFGYSAFRGPQAEIVDHVVAGGDALVLMPTGGGKSLCYQVPAIARHRAGQGLTVVVSPLIALMHDQVGALEEAGVHASFLNSTLDLAEVQRIEREMMSGRLVMLYVAPERLTTPRMLAQLDSLAERGLLSLFAIDEAHCVSQWGHDFRADYLGLSVLHERFAGVPRIALTATADEHTRADIIERLAARGRAPVHQQLRPAEHPLPRGREGRSAAPAAALPARRARGRGRHRLLPEPQEGRRDRGLARWRRPRRAALSRRPRRRRRARRTRTASCARTAS